MSMTRTPINRSSKRSYAIHDAFQDADEPITNDDEKEKLEYRRKMAAEEEAQKKKQAIGTDDNRKSFGGHLPGLSAQQLSEHYNNCLQLFNENKITQKNAFNLQLIDYMAMMLKKRDKQMDNFSVVSCTLDASTKIYAYRVDHVHSDALKMAGGLAAAEASNKNKQSKGEDSDVSDNEEGSKEKTKEKLKRKKRSKQRVTIVPNPESLNRKNFELGSWNNRQIVEAGESSILSNATLVGDSCALQISDETRYWITTSEDDKKVSNDKEVPLKIPEIPAEAKISETLDGFSIVNWDENDDAYDDEDEDMDTGNANESKMSNQGFIDKNLVFDVNEPAQPIPDFEPDFFDDRPDDVDSDAEEVIGQQRLKAARKSTKDAITDIQRLISTEPLEYSYFQNNLVSLWHGPAHWKIKPLSKFLEDEELKQGQQKKKDKMKKNKNTIEISFDSNNLDADLSSSFKQLRQTQLTKQTLLKWNKHRNTTTPDSHYEIASLFRLFLKPCLYVRSKPLPEDIPFIADIENLPFEEKVENISGVGADTTTNEDVEMDNDMGVDNDDDDARSFNSLVAEEADLPNNDANPVEQNPVDAFVGDNLVEPPNKIAKLSIQYALRPKVVDMKKLKSAIWECICLQTDINKENTPKKSSSVEKKKVIKFSEIQDQIKTILPKKLAEDLNCSLCLVALLHIANEKNLCVQGVQDQSDLLISQG